MTTVLLVEDDPAISEPLARALGREGYDVRAHATGAEALADVRGVDLVVLDLGLPDMDGLDVAREIRSSGNRVPILILTARTDEVDMVVGLDAGADDYVTKPFRLAELLARVRALLRRQAAEPAEGELRAQDIRPVPRRLLTCTCRGCAASSETTRPTRTTSRPCAGWDSASRTLAERVAEGGPLCAFAR